MSAREGGSATLELSLGAAVLLLPMVMTMAMLPVWLERASVGALAAREAARAFVLSSEPAQASRVAADVVRRIVTSHGFDPAEVDMTVTGELRRGGIATVTTSTRVPLVRVPLLGTVGGFTITRRHQEVVDPYRSW